MSGTRGGRNFAHFRIAGGEPAMISAIAQRRRADRTSLQLRILIARGSPQLSVAGSFIWQGHDGFNMGDEGSRYGSSASSRREALSTSCPDHLAIIVGQRGWICFECTPSSGYGSQERCFSFLVFLSSCSAVAANITDRYYVQHAYGYDYAFRSDVQSDEDRTTLPFASFWSVSFPLRPINHLTKYSFLRCEFWLGRGYGPKP